MRNFFLVVLLLVLTGFMNAQVDNNTNFKNLITTSPISVTIGGNFIVTGTFQASSNERVDQFVTRIYNAAREKMSSSVKEPQAELLLEKKLDDYSFRNVTLKRMTGEALVIDLQRFRDEGDFKNNPYLKNDDVIIFPPADLERNFFTVDGAVNSPGKFHFIDGDKLSDALRLAKGINKAFENVEFAEINRLNYSGDKLEIIKVKIDSDVPLQRGDRVIIAADETQRKEFTIRVYGEVRNEGLIPVTKNNSTIKDVLIRAGGVTENADLSRAKVFKESSFNFILKEMYNIPDEEKTMTGEKLFTNSFYWSLLDFDYLQMFRMNTLTNDDSTYFYIENRLKAFAEGTSFSFENYLDDNSDAAKYILRDGDIVVIPPKSHTVYVYGQVTRPGHLNYQQGANLDYYIQKAGGFGEMSIRDEVMVIKGKSKEWVHPDSTSIEEGDMIFVPREMALSFNEYVRRFGSYISILGSVATIILLLLQLGK